MSIPLFLNPLAGRGRAKRTRSSLTALLTAKGIEHEIVESTAPGDLEQKVQQAVTSGTRRLLVGGGDGSIHEAVNGMLASGATAEFGVIPLGRGNDFAKACSIPLHWEDAALLLVDRLNTSTPPRPVDAGRMNERYFANGAGIGIDARVTGIARTMHLPIGDLVYLLATLRLLRHSVSKYGVHMSFGGDVFDGDVMLVNVSNGPWVGGMFHISPSAINDDGALDLLISQAASRWRVLTLLPKLIAGTHLGEPEITHFRIDRCEIVAHEPLPSHLDGELQPLQTRFEFETLPGALLLL